MLKAISWILTTQSHSLKPSQRTTRATSQLLAQSVFQYKQREWSKPFHETLSCQSHSHNQFVTTTRIADRGESIQSAACKAVPWMRLDSCYFFSTPSNDARKLETCNHSQQVCRDSFLCSPTLQVEITDFDFCSLRSFFLLSSFRFWCFGVVVWCFCSSFGFLIGWLLLLSSLMDNCGLTMMSRAFGFVFTFVSYNAFFWMELVIMVARDEKAC